MAVVLNFVHGCLFGSDLVSDDEVVAGVEVDCPIVYFGADCHYSVDDYEVGFVVVTSIL